MKKLLSGVFAAILSLSLGVPAFAASPVVKNLTDLTSQAISEDGKQYVGGDTISPNQTIYFLIPDSAAQKIGDSRTMRISTRKTKNAKLVKSVKLVEKKLTSSAGNYTVPNNKPIVTNVEDGLDDVAKNRRNLYLAVDLNDTTSSDEYKVELEVSLTSRKNGVSFNYGNAASNNDSFLVTPLDNGDKLVLRAGFYVGNSVEAGASGIVSGNRGVTIHPTPNEENEVQFENSDGDELAMLQFTATSNPDKFYAKLSTKWTSSLLSKFKNTDAVIRRFTPATIDSTSRATLSLYNPFDEDEVEPEDVYVYALNSKGTLTDVTRSFSFDEDENAFVTRTRSLGTWILSDRRIRIS